MITDCGAFVYSADYEARNRFRATAAHNTPRIVGEEINRFIAPDHLWSFRNDARPELRRWETSPERDLFCGAHSGYQRLASPVTPVRTIELDKQTHALTVVDEFQGRPDGKVEIPLHLAPGVEILSWSSEGRVSLCAQEREFELIWGDFGTWQMSIEDAQVSPSYGVAVNSKRLVWTSIAQVPKLLDPSATESVRMRMKKLRRRIVDFLHHPQELAKHFIDADFVVKVLSALATKGLLFIFSIAVTVLVTRALGPSGRGIYALAITLSALGVQFGNFGLHSSNTFYVAKNPDLLGKLIANTLCVSLGGGSIIAGLLAAFFMVCPNFAPIQGWSLALGWLESHLVSPICCSRIYCWAAIA